MNSKAKGKRGELEWARFCREQGYDVRRTAQYCGNPLRAASAQRGGNMDSDSSDCIGLPGVHIEVKRTEHLRLYDAMEQTVRDNRDNGDLPIVAHRRNNSEWLVVMRADDWFRLYREWEAGR